MVRLRQLGGLCLLLACTAGGEDNVDEPGDTDGDTNETTTVDREAITGDFACFTPSAEYSEITWLTQDVDPALRGTAINLEGQVNDFQDDDDPARGETTVSLWFDDLADGLPDASAQTDNSDERLGQLEIEGQACEPLTYLALRNPALQDAKPTYKAHQVYPPEDGHAAEYTTVSVSTYLLIPSVLGVSPDIEKSIISGTAFDCSRQPETLSDVDAGKVANAWIRVTDLEGNEPPGVDVHYFIDGADGPFPDRDLTATSDNGIWTAINVPVGEYRVEMWGLLDGEEVILGSSVITSIADSINIANIYAGYEGVKYPGACLVSDAPVDTDAPEDTDMSGDTDAP